MIFCRYKTHQEIIPFHETLGELSKNLGSAFMLEIKSEDL